LDSQTFSRFDRYGEKLSTLTFYALIELRTKIAPQPKPELFTAFELERDVLEIQSESGLGISSRVQFRILHKIFIWSIVSVGIERPLSQLLTD
jgi:hypothetical protein